MANIQIDTYFEYGVDKENRRIFLLSDIEDENINKIIKGIYLLDRDSISKPIELFISSFGGSVYDMFALYDVMNTTRCPIHTVAIGKCMSAAPLLVACGQKGNRYTLPNTQWMVHQTSYEQSEGRVDAIKMDIIHLDDVNNRWASLMEKHSKLKKRDWLRICNKTGDQYFSADKALEYGLVDHMWSEK